MLIAATSSVRSLIDEIQSMFSPGFTVEYLSILDTNGVAVGLRFACPATGVKVKRGMRLTHEAFKATMAAELFVEALRGLERQLMRDYVNGLSDRLSRLGLDPFDLVRGDLPGQVGDGEMLAFKEAVRLGHTIDPYGFDDIVRYRDRYCDLLNSRDDLC